MAESRRRLPFAGSAPRASAGTRRARLPPRAASSARIVPPWSTQQHGRPGARRAMRVTAATTRALIAACVSPSLPAVAARLVARAARPGSAPRSRPSSAPTTRRRRSRAAADRSTTGRPRARRDDLGRLARPAQVARVDRVDRHAREPLARAPAPARRPARSAADRRGPASGARGSSRSRRAGRGGSSSRPTRLAGDGSRPRRQGVRRHRLDRRDRARDRAAAPRGGGARSSRRAAAASGIGDLHVARRPLAARRARAADRGGARALRPRRLPRQQRRRHRDPPLRRAHRRRLGGVLAAQRDERRARAARGAAGDARAAERRDRERLVDRGEAPVRRRCPSTRSRRRRCSRSRGSSPTSTRRTGSAATRSRPGPTATEAWLGDGGLADQQGDRDEVLAKVGAGRPLGRLAQPEEIAAVIVFLCSDRAELRHRRRLERRRRHRPDHHLSAPPRCREGRRRGYAGRMPQRCRTARRLVRRAHPPARGATRSRRSPCARTRRAAAAADEDECRVRTPFQRDRDRIVHSKPFRRLKGKTQVFIDPAGDHYRTRMTHTLETTGIARVVARALRLNEDLVEAIGLGHDTGHTPFGHAGEEALDAALRERFGGRFRHNEQSLRIAERLNLTHEVRDGILTHTGEREPETLEGKIVRIVDRVAYINHDIDDAIRYGILDEADLPRRRDRGARPDRLDADRHARPRPDRDVRARGRHRPERRDRRARCSRCARSCSSASTSARRRGAEHERARATVRRIFDALADRGDDPDEITEFIAGMTDRFALEYARALYCGSGADQGHDRRGRPAGRRLRRGRRGADAAAQGRRAPVGPLPVPRGADAELLGQPGRQALLLLRLQQGRRHDRLRAARRRGSTSSARSNGSPTASTSRSSTRTHRPEDDAQPPAPRAAARRCSRTRRRSTSATCGTRRPARSPATTSPAAASARRSAASSGSASRSAATTLTRKALEKGFTAEELRAAGLDAASAAATTSSAGCCSRSPTRAAACSASRRGGCTRTTRCAAKYVNTPESELFTRARSSTGSTRRARRSRARTAPASSRATPT